MGLNLINLLLQNLKTVIGLYNAQHIIYIVKKLNDIQKSKKLANPNNFLFGGERILPQQNIYLIRWCNESGVKKIRIHDLRHSHVSLLISTGGQSLSLVYVIAKCIGDTPEQIFKTYGHMFLDDEKMVLDNLNKCIDNNNLNPNETQVAKSLA